MPRPDPNPDESMQAFMDRCMGDSGMLDEFPEDPQRFAVCMTQWEDKRDAPMLKTEVRTFRHFSQLGEIRVEKRDDGKRHITGTAITFGRQSVDLGGFTEVVSPDVKINFDVELVSLFNHNPDNILGRSPQTLAVTRTKDGVLYDVTPAETPIAQHVLASIERGDVRGNSFMFWTRKDSWDQVDGKQLRTLLEIDVQELGPVTFPAYRDTDVAVAMRSLDLWKRGITVPRGQVLRRRIGVV